MRCARSRLAPEPAVGACVGDELAKAVAVAVDDIEIRGLDIDEKLGGTVVARLWRATVSFFVRAAQYLQDSRHQGDANNGFETQLHDFGLHPSSHEWQA